MITESTEGVVSGECRSSWLIDPLSDRALVQVRIYDPGRAAVLEYQ